MEHEKEHQHAEAAKRIDERREQHDRRNQAPQQIEEIEDEIPHQKNRHQHCPDQSQQRRVFECHGRSMNAASVSRNRNFPEDESDLGGFAAFRNRATLLRLPRVPSSHVLFLALGPRYRFSAAVAANHSAR